MVRHEFFLTKQQFIAQQILGGSDGYFVNHPAPLNQAGGQMEVKIFNLVLFVFNIMESDGRFLILWSLQDEHANIH